MAPAGTYNAFQKAGNVVENPRHAVRLADSDDWLGGDLRGVSVKEAADYLLHRTKGVTLGELSDYYSENGHPDVVFEGREGDEEVKRTFEWDGDEDQYYPIEDD